MSSPFSSIGGNGTCGGLGIIATQNALSGKLVLNEATMLLQANSNFDGRYPFASQMAGALLTHANPVPVSPLVSGVSAGNRNSSDVRLMPVSRSNVTLL